MKFLSAMKAERCVSQLLAEPDSNTPQAQKALQSLKNTGSGAIPIMINALASADRYQTIGLVDALSEQVSDLNFKHIAKGLSHPNDRCVAGVAAALSSSQNFSADKLPQILKEEDIATHAVLDIMRTHLDKLNIRQLLSVAYHLEPREKSAVFKMIGEKATEDLLPDLLSRTAGRDHAARVHIIRLLENFSTPEVQDTLERLLRDENRQVRAAALKALGGMDTKQNIELIVSLLLDNDLDVQNRAVELLIKLNDPETCKYLVGVLRDESEYTRRNAVEVLNEIADPESIKLLLTPLGDGDWWVRSRACDALGKIGGPRVLSAVMGLIHDKDENIRRSAIEILNQTKDENAVKYLIKATGDDDWWVSERAVDALGEIADPQALPRLLEMLNGNPKSIASVVKALGKMGDISVVPQIIATLQRPEPDIIAEAITALSFLIDDTNVNEIRAIIQPMLQVAHENIAMAASEAFERIENRYSPSMIEDEEKAQRMAEPAHTMLIDEADMQKIAGLVSSAATPQAPAVPETAPLDVTTLKTGDMIESRYKYIQKIGKGAFGTVILVEDTVVDEQLILKFLNANVAEDEDMLQRFVHELRFSRKITHKNVIRIYDFLNLAGSYAISMEYFNSHTLGEEVRGEPLPFDKAAGWATDIAMGMTVAHQVGIIHRDLKPANLLIDDNGLLKIVDFGVAAAAGGGATDLTKTGYVIGSPKYMAPEQILGKKVDERADIYSLGIIFYEMLCGAPPYTKGDHMAVMYQHVQGACPRCDKTNPEIPRELANVVHKAMEVDKLKRFESMDEFQKAINAAMAS
jgi:serine/threonine-protein kinase